MVIFQKVEVVTSFSFWTRWVEAGQSYGQSRYFWHVGKVCWLTADLIPGVIGKKCKQALRRSISSWHHTRWGVEAAEANGMAVEVSAGRCASPLDVCFGCFYSPNGGQVSFMRHSWTVLLKEKAKKEQENLCELSTLGIDTICFLF